MKALKQSFRLGLYFRQGNQGPFSKLKLAGPVRERLPFRGPGYGRPSDAGQGGFPERGRQTEPRANTEEGPSPEGAEGMQTHAKARVKRKVY